MGIPRGSPGIKTHRITPRRALPMPPSIYTPALTAAFRTSFTKTPRLISTSLPGLRISKTQFSPLQTTTTSNFARVTTSRHFSSTPTQNFQPTTSNMTVHNLADNSSFNTSVQQASAGRVVLVDCFATWCGPCKMIAPKVSAMSQEEKYKDSVDFYKIDVDEVPDVAQELGIRAMPTFLVFKNGEQVEEIVGANERAIRAAVDKHL